MDNNNNINININLAYESAIRVLYLDDQETDRQQVRTAYYWPPPLNTLVVVMNPCTVTVQWQPPPSELAGDEDDEDMPDAAAEQVLAQKAEYVIHREWSSTLKVEPAHPLAQSLEALPGRRYRGAIVMATTPAVPVVVDGDGTWRTTTLTLRHHAAQEMLLRGWLPMNRKGPRHGAVWIGPYPNATKCPVMVIAPPALARNPPAAAMDKKGGLPHWCRDDAPLFWRDGATARTAFVPAAASPTIAWAEGVIGYADGRVERLADKRVRLMRAEHGRWVSALAAHHQAPRPTESEMREQRIKEAARHKVKKEEALHALKRERAQPGLLDFWLGKPAQQQADASARERIVKRPRRE